jgi:ubiquitin-conjugating enzyme E2 variant
MAVMVLIGKVVATWLTTDFLSGLFHWLEDAYGNPFWPLVGRHVTKPNILHHLMPRAFVTNSWYLSSRLLLLVCSLLALITLATGTFNWMLALGLILGVNANQVHKWSHRTRHENGALVRLLQRLRLIQSPAHHHRHHVLGKNTHYCVLTDFLNPVLDRVGFWRALEWLIARAFGIQRRDDATAAIQVLTREPEFFGEYVAVIRQRLASAPVVQSRGV